MGCGSVPLVFPDSADGWRDLYNTSRESAKRARERGVTEGGLPTCSAKLPARPDFQAISMHKRCIDLDRVIFTRL